jgi:hypothetical protein
MYCAFTQAPAKKERIGCITCQNEKFIGIVIAKRTGERYNKNSVKIWYRTKITARFG